MCMVPNELDVPNVKTDIRSLFKDLSQQGKTREFFLLKMGDFSMYRTIVFISKYLCLIVKSENSIYNVYEHDCMII